MIAELFTNSFLGGLVREYTVKSVKTIASQYERQLTRFVREASEHTMDATDMARAHRALLRTMGPDAYVEGLKAGGVDESEMDVTDQVQIDAWLKEQLSSVNGFAKDAYAAGTNAVARKEVTDRVGFWVSALESLAGYGRMSAQENAMTTWKLGKTKEHCSDCYKLNGQRHRLKWFKSQGFIPREPGSKELACGGWRCDCRLVDDRGRKVI